MKKNNSLLLVVAYCDVIRLSIMSPGGEENNNNNKMTRTNKTAKKTEWDNVKWPGGEEIRLIIHPAGF